jgi:tRNA (cytidine/uridine-2'-O-)-methyltransferase
MRLALYQPDIPQNLGAAMRLSAAFAVELDVIEPCGFPLGDKMIRRAAMDYAACAKVSHHTSWEAYLGFVAGMSQPARLVLMTTRAAQPLYEFAFQPGDIMLMGREARAFRKTCMNAPMRVFISPCHPRRGRSMSSTPPPWRWAKACGKSRAFPVRPERV